MNLGAGQLRKARSRTSEDPTTAAGHVSEQTPPIRVPLFRRLLVQSIGVGLCYLIVFVYFSIRVDNFLDGSNIRTILDGLALLGIVCVGQTFLIVGGGFDLSVGGVVPLGAVVFGTTLGNIGLVPATLAAVCVGALVGVTNGITVVYAKINPLITTLAMLSIAGGVAYVVADGQTVGLSAAHAGLWGYTGPLGLQLGTWAFIALSVVAAIVLRFTVYGRTIYTIGGNREAAALAGLRVSLNSISQYTLSGACAAFGGVIAASELLASAPDIGTTTTLNSLAAVFLGGAALTGGVGGMPGTIIGVLLLGTISDGLALLQVPSFYQTIVTGVVLLVAVGFSRLRDLLSQSQFIHSATEQRNREVSQQQ